MRTIKQAFIYLFLSTLLLSCSDEEPEQYDDLPGAFVATIDGETVDFSYQPRATKGTMNDIPGMFFYGSTPDSNYYQELDISIQNVNGLGTYNLGGATENLGYYSFAPVETGIVTSYGTSLNAVGVLTVTGFTENKISGTFNFNAQNIDDADDIIQISGTFDLRITN